MYYYHIIIVFSKLLARSLYGAQGTWVGRSAQWDWRLWLRASALHPKPPQTVGQAGGG